MIYLFQELSSFSEQSFEESLQLLTPERREYILHFKRPEDQKRSALAWLLLAYGLRKEYGIETVPGFQKAASGKPFFSGENMPFFNLSHSGNFVGCALHNREIGLDIQKITNPRESLIRKVCTPNELDRLHTSADFCRIWAMKESTVKLTGEGITGNFRDVFTLHPDISTYTFPLKKEAGFLAYSVYEETQLPLQIVSTTELFRILCDILM